MANTLYNLFRSIIKDETAGSYILQDPTLFRYLDAAIQKMSELHQNIYKETIVVTETDLSNGYITLTKEPVEILLGLQEGLRRVSWDYGKGKQIRIIDSSYWPTGEYDFRYRAKYNQYAGEIRDDDYFDFDSDAYLAIVLYAVGYYAQFNTAVNEDGSFGFIKKKVEENLQIEYGLDGDIATASSPKGLMESAINMFRDLPNAQDTFFSV